MYTLFDQCLTEAPDTQFIFCCVDLNNFRSVNNTYGPEQFGNKVLREVAQRLAKFGATFRMGGNRFGILLPVTAEQGQDYPFAIRKTIEDLRWADAPSLRLSCRVGSAHYPTECRTLDDIIRLSDDRLYAEWLERKHPNTSTA
jgi:diguanylate cyclase (GGDEF)-like protein